MDDKLLGQLRTARRTFIIFETPEEGIGFRSAERDRRGV